MLKFRVTYRKVETTRTPSSPRYKVIEAEDIHRARREAEKDAEFAWGHDTISNIEEL